MVAVLKHRLVEVRFDNLVGSERERRGSPSACTVLPAICPLFYQGLEGKQSRVNAN